MQPESIFKRIAEKNMARCLQSLAGLWTNSNLLPRIKNLLLHYMHIYGALQTFTVSSLRGLHLRQISTSDTTSPDDITQTQLEDMSDLVLSVNSSKTSSQTCPASKAVYSIAADSHDRTAINMSNNCVSVPSAADSKGFIQPGH